MPADTDADDHDTLVFSERDRRLFFDVLVDPPEPAERLVRAFEAAERRVERR